MKPRRIFSALLLSLGLILLTFAATCRLVMTNIQIDYDPSSPATVTLTVFGQSDEYTLAIDAVGRKPQILFQRRNEHPRQRAPPQD